MNDKQIQGILGEMGSILLLCVGTYLAGEYGKWGNISWEGIVGGVMMLIGIFFFLVFASVRDSKLERKEKK